VNDPYLTRELAEVRQLVDHLQVDDILRTSRAAGLVLDRQQHLLEYLAVKVTQLSETVETLRAIVQRGDAP
jgi:hypothetical protein